MTKKETDKTPWSTKAVMAQIYEQHLWGRKDFDFYSGIGSHDSFTVNSYVKVVTDFFKSKNNALAVCDLGCGDFNIGHQLVPHTSEYFAIDIVNALIERNKTLFKAEHLEFCCLDISKEELPKADCVILRQVLQHLSNAEIKRIIDKLSNYKYIILTEHLPSKDFEPNKDKIASQGIRIKQNSGVDVLAEPFNLKVKSSEVINEIMLDDNKGRIVTTLYIL